MNLDVTTIILFAVAILLGVAYFVRRSARLKRQHRKL
jgi:hypothetical protein